MKVTIKYGTDSLSKSFASGSTIGTIKRSNAVKNSLGFGDNVKFLVNDVEVGESAELVDGMTVRVETAANTKAASVTVRYGADEFQYSVSGDTTLRDIVNSARVKNALGYGDRIRVLVNDVEQGMDAVIPPATVIRIETAANTKAV